MSSARQTWGVRLRKDEVNDQSKKKKKWRQRIEIQWLRKDDFLLEQTQ